MGGAGSDPAAVMLYNRDKEGLTTRGGMWLPWYEPKGVVHKLYCLEKGGKGNTIKDDLLNKPY